MRVKKPKKERKKEYAVTENIHSPPPHRRDCNFVGDGGVESFFKTKTLKKFDEAELEFLEGWGS